MSEYKPILIAGFGRSGTTWLSDIISKSVGGIILFEPYHPCVYDKAEEATYNTRVDITDISDHWSRISTGLYRDRWLLRNHLRSPIEATPEKFVHDIWQHTAIMGFKTIRLNHTLHPVAQALGAQLLYIVRHPLAVVSSIEGRDRFWLEFGWQWHWQSFITRALLPMPVQISAALREMSKELVSRRQQIIFMWTISQIISLRQVDSSGGVTIGYEDLYERPYLVTRKLLDNLGYGDKRIHPSYIFEPSMTTLRTFHNSEEEHQTKSPEIFWKSRINKVEEQDLMQVVRRVMTVTGYRHPMIDIYLDQ